MSLGCPRNLVDSEHLAADLRQKGYRISEVSHADIALINTCAFIEDAKKESIEAILSAIELKKQGKLKKVLVAGCLAQRYGRQLAKEFPEVDAFIGKLPLAGKGQEREALTPSHYAYLKISEGCVHRCSFCAIPRIKGAYESLRLPKLLGRAKELDAAGVKELVVIGQDISGWGLDLFRQRRLPWMLSRLLKASPRVQWFRLLYLYPHPVIRDLLKLMQDEPRICRYIDIPVQHVSERILRAMRRGVTAVQVRRLIDMVRRELPDAALRTSVIVGFPSETRKEFSELLQFMRDTRFERLGAFIYSREEGTAAFALPGQVGQAEKQRRFDAVMQLQQEIATEVNAGFMGKVCRVLIDEKKGREYLGRTQYDAPEVDGMVYVRGARALAPGDMIDVRITDTLEYDLVGEALERTQN